MASELVPRYESDELMPVNDLRFVRTYAAHEWGRKIEEWRTITSLGKLETPDLMKDFV